MYVNTIHVLYTTTVLIHVIPAEISNQCSPDSMKIDYALVFMGLYCSTISLSQSNRCYATRTIAFIQQSTRLYLLSYSLIGSVLQFGMILRISLPVENSFGLAENWCASTAREIMPHGTHIVTDSAVMSTVSTRILLTLGRGPGWPKLFGVHIRPNDRIEITVLSVLGFSESTVASVSRHDVMLPLL